MIRLSVFQASSAAYVKLRLAGTANRLNVEHRTSNIERRILMALRFIESKTSESQPATSSAESNLEGWFCFAQPFIKSTEYIIGCWTFNVRCSTFIFLVTTSCETAKVSISIKLAVFLANGWADT
jgi:hypothetical protein